MTKKISKDYIKRAAKCIYIVGGGPGFGDLSDSQKISVLRFFLRNEELIAAAQFVLKNGLSYCRQGNPQMVDHVIESGILTNEELDSLRAKELIRPSRSSRAPDRIGFIYLARNERNQLIKIGFSKNPKTRESTLQSEEPEVRIIRTRSGTLKEEREIHFRFSTQRVRGEWFRLSEDDIDSIIPFQL